MTLDLMREGDGQCFGRCCPNLAGFKEAQKEAKHFILVKFLGERSWTAAGAARLFGRSRERSRGSQALVLVCALRTSCRASPAG